eukprot:CAMPEP_0175005516 /NCGR_PEP_ID=MMETSP0005-20121125/5357_1 /TAXON_ID=420556 /ORGANISM="Ochromonas sp., Strain CCMP1393" /LENGTH=626 /DNA_ID=CAMNT_0016260771 /DNA_START=231 /DNA_END=2111 /DNA_ORIENTATION=+
MPVDANVEVSAIVDNIKQKGDEIRELKASKAEKDLIMVQVQQLKELKAKYEEISGQPFDPPSEKQKKSATKKKPDAKGNKASAGSGGAESIMITPRGVDYSSWYNDVIYAADMVDQSPVRGCMVIKPWGMGVWDLLRNDLDERIRDSGATNAYFPLFIPQSFLSKEAEHVDGFAKECAVVTHHRLCASPDNPRELIPDPDAKLDPTSETVIWSMFSKWIASHRDLPLKINQWANVVRWELRTRPFLRSAEFLWQEGHTAHATAEDAIKTARESLDLYADACKHMLAVPVVKGVKSPSERFAGADDTYTIEALMQNGWALQSGTSHFLGQNFARAFDVFYQTEQETRELVWATSWGVSTRLLGALVMTHSDDKGLVLPPPVAPVQVVIEPITKGSGPAPAPASGSGTAGSGSSDSSSSGSSSGSSDHEQVMAKVERLRASLRAAGVRVRVDDRPNMRPGAKYFEWERKGLPLRVDLGARDLGSGQASMAVRHTGEKTQVAIDSENGFVQAVQAALAQMHSDLYAAAETRLQEKTFRLTSYEEMKSYIAAAAGETADGAGGEKDLSKAGFYLVPWKCDAANEDKIKEDCKATIRCYPTEENLSPPAEGTKCFYSGEPATHMAIFARAF